MFFARKGKKQNGLKKKFAVERLEDRAMMAGDVFVSVVAGDLRVTGNNLGNGIVITQVASQTFTVSGSYVAGGATRVNGSYGVVRFTGVTDDVEVSLNGGDDRVVVGGTSEATRDILPDDLTINAGTGNDTVLLQWLSNRDSNDNIRVVTDMGDDSVSAYKVVSRYNFTIDTGGNWDRVDLNYITTGRQLAVYTGAGNDSFKLNQAIVYQLMAQMGSEADTVGLRNSSFSTAPNVNGGVGADTLNRYNLNRTVTHALFERFTYLNS